MKGWSLERSEIARNKINAHSERAAQYMRVCVCLCGKSKSFLAERQQHCGTIATTKTKVMLS